MISKNLCIVLTTRGNYAKFSRLMDLAKAMPNINLQTVMGGELLLHERVTGLFDLDSTLRVYFNVAGSVPVSIGKSVGMAVGEFCSAFDALRPDLVMVVGDRFETYGAATAAYICGIPIAHLEGGEVTGTLDNHLRYAISELSAFHFPCTNHAGEKLRERGYSRVHVVGSTSLDILAHAPLKTRKDLISLQKITGSGTVLDPENPFLLVVWHPDTLSNDVSHETEELIGAVERFGWPTFWLNSNLDAGEGAIGGILRAWRDAKKPDYVHFFKSLPIEYYGFLLKNASCILGNSSSGIREACFLGTPNISIGNRQENREAGKNTLHCRPDAAAILENLLYQVEHGRYEPDFLYGDGNASQKIMEVICEQY